MNGPNTEQRSFEADPEDGPISGALGRRIDDVESGKVKMVTYASADDYLEHLDAVLGE